MSGLVLTVSGQAYFAPARGGKRSAGRTSMSAGRKSLLDSNFCSYFYDMVRRAGKKRSSISPAEERRVLTLVLALACIPMLAAVSAIIVSDKPDLSDLVPVTRCAGDYLVLDWDSLRHSGRHALNTASAAFVGAAVQALGYMMESGQGSELVLLPEAGNFLHPAHRFGDQMIAVHLRAAGSSAFAPGDLVWAKGIMRTAPGDPRGSRPLYAIEQASVERAGDVDVRRYFR
jgi:hypothetical protein